MPTVRHLLLVAATAALTLQASLAPAFDLSAPDKKKHAGAEFAIALTTNSFLRAYDELSGQDSQEHWLRRSLLTTGIALVPGIVKEIMDSQQPRNKFDPEDLAADAIGVVAGTLAGEVLWGGLLYFAKQGETYSVGYRKGF